MYQLLRTGTILSVIFLATSACDKSTTSPVESGIKDKADTATTVGEPDASSHDATAIATGGVAGSDGIVATGGVVGAGGASADAGSHGIGGATGTGGVLASGGLPGSGGRKSSGGAPGTGGLPGGGGSRSSGGAPGTGGMVAVDGGQSIDGGAGGTTGLDGAAAAGGTTSGTLPGSTAAGAIPASLPSRMMVGVFAPDNGETWMKQSGVKWDVRWVYLSGQHGQDWYNDWGYGSADGSWASDWFTQCDQQGFIPGIHLYNIGYGHDQGDAGLLTEIRNATFIANYFTEWKALMQLAKKFGKPVIIVLEGDSFGMIEMLTKNDPNAAATIGSSGMADLSGLPDTIAGLGMAYLKIRSSVGATNVAIGPDVPAYAANGDILNGDNSDLQAHVDYQMKFFQPFGLGANATGDRFDFQASNPLSGDADYYRIVGGDSGRWWDASDTASVNAKSFNRYAEWLRLFNQAAGRRWILHQIPVGNSNMLNVNSDCGAPTDKCTPRTGYKDNRPEYFFNYDAPSSKALRDQHLAKFADAGVIGLLFGAGDGGSTTPYNDTWTDGQLFLKSRVGAVLSAGGFAIAP
jgi:hypothetical protein